MADEQWTEIGNAEELKLKSLQEVMCGTTPIALTYKNGSFAAISDACNHAGGPLGGGTLDGEYVVCPWHYWKFHRQTAQGEPGYEQDQVPAYAIKIENGQLFMIGKVLGHRQARTTERYSHLSDDLPRQVADRAASKIEAALKLPPEQRKVVRLRKRQ